MIGLSTSWITSLNMVGNDLVLKGSDGSAIRINLPTHGGTSVPLPRTLETMDLDAVTPFTCDDCGRVLPWKMPEEFPTDPYKVVGAGTCICKTDPMTALKDLAPREAK